MFGFFFSLMRSTYSDNYKVRDVRVVQEKKRLDYAIILFSLIMYFVRCTGSMKAAQLRTRFQL